VLEIRKTAISLDEKELLKLERIVIDSDEKGASSFLKKVIHSQQGKLKSHLDIGSNPVENFKRR